jgi:hypothetical protein
MPKFTLISEHPGAYKVTHEFEVEFLPHVLENIELFLRGTGFCPTGKLEFVDEDCMVTTTQLGDDILATFADDYFTGDGHDGMGSTLDEYPEIKSSYYFDTERNK